MVFISYREELRTQCVPGCVPGCWLPPLGCYFVFVGVLQKPALQRAAALVRLGKLSCSHNPSGASFPSATGGEGKRERRDFSLTQSNLCLGASHSPSCPPCPLACSTSTRMNQLNCVTQYLRRQSRPRTSAWHLVLTMA